MSAQRTPPGDGPDLRSPEPLRTRRADTDPALTEQQADLIAVDPSAAPVRLKLDENLPHDLADELTRRGHNVDTVLDEQLGGRKDPAIVQAATDGPPVLSGGGGLQPLASADVAGG